MFHLTDKKGRLNLKDNFLPAAFPRQSSRSEAEGNTLWFLDEDSLPTLPLLGCQPLVNFQSVLLWLGLVSLSLFLELIYSAVLASGVQQSDLVIRLHAPILSQALFLVWIITERRAEFAVLYSSSSLVLSSHIQQCMCVNPKLIIPPCLAPLVTRNLLSISINLFLLCKSVHLHIFGPWFLLRVHFISCCCWRQCQSLTLILLLLQHRHLIHCSRCRARLAGPGFCRDFFPQACVQWHGLLASQSAKCKHSMKAWPCAWWCPLFTWHVITLVRERRIESRALQLTPSCCLPHICLSPSIKTRKASSPLFFLLFFLTTFPLLNTGI